MTQSVLPTRLVRSLHAIALCLGVAQAGQAAGAAATAPPTWVELGESGVIIARQVVPLGTNGATCPSIKITGVSNPPTQLQARASPDPTNFPVLVCEVVIPNGATKAKIGDISLPLPSANPKSILVIGDTGCKGSTTANDAKDNDDDDANDAGDQQCTSAGWPLQGIAEQAAKAKPDLVIHVGDYVYVKADTWSNGTRSFLPPRRSSCWQHPGFSSAATMKAATFTAPVTSSCSTPVRA